MRNFDWDESKAGSNLRKLREDDDMRPEYDFSKGVRGGAYSPLQ